MLHGIDRVIRPGERIAVMGRSGGSRSTLLGLLSDHLAPEAAMIPQAAALVRPLGVFHNVSMGRLDRHSTLRNAPARSLSPAALKALHA